MKAPATIITESNITVFLNGKVHTVNINQPNFKDVKEVIINEDWENLESTISVSRKIETWANDSGIEIMGGVIYYNREEIHSSVTEKILDLISEGYSSTPLINFLNNLMGNPSKTAVDELYLFLESAKLPITEDGYVIAYKKVRDDYKDIYTGTFDNSVGSICEMPRNQVCDDRDKTCSAGLHVAAYDYMKHYGVSNANRVVAVKINPADFVSIPSDYNNAKARVSRYEVIEDLGTTHSFNKLPDTVYEDDYDGEEIYNFEKDTVKKYIYKRPNGRFTARVMLDYGDGYDIYTIGTYDSIGEAIDAKISYIQSVMEDIKGWK